MTTIDRQADEIARLRLELAQTREEARATLQQAIAGNALAIHALDCALQWGEALFAFLPEGMVLSEGVKTAKGALDQALQELGVRR